MYVDEKDGREIIVCTVGTTILHYDYRALADLHGRDLTSQLNQISEEQVIERQMRDLKAKQKPARNVPLLHEGKTHPSPLIPPMPQADTPVKKVAESGKGKGEENNSGNSTTPVKEPDLTELKKLFD
jgi:hypothetical protein